MPPEPPAALCCDRPTRVRIDVPTLKLPVLKSSPGDARRFLNDMLAGLVPAGHLDDLRLIASELVTNAVLAAGTLRLGWTYLDTPIRLGVLTAARWTRLDVRDPVPKMPESEPGDLLAECGRGLFLVDSVALKRWSTSDATGKTVHALVPMPMIELSDAEQAEAGWHE